RIGPTVEYPPGPKFFPELRVLGIVRTLGLLLGVEVIEIAEELVKSVRRGKELIAVAELVLAELSCGVAKRFQEFGDRRVCGLQAEICSGQSHLGQASPDRRLAGNKRGAARRAALLPIPVCKQTSLFGHPVDVRRAIAHDSEVVGAYVEPSDVITPDNE